MIELVTRFHIIAVACFRVIVLMYMTFSCPFVAKQFKRSFNKTLTCCILRIMRGVLLRLAVQQGLRALERAGSAPVWERCLGVKRDKKAKRKHREKICPSPRVLGGNDHLMYSFRSNSSENLVFSTMMYQISAFYQKMLPRTPHHFVPADDQRFCQALLASGG